MNILFLCHRIPFPPNKGDKIRSFNELVFLSKRHRIYLGTTMDDESDEPYVKALERYCQDIHAVRFNRKLKRLKSLFSGKPFSISNFYDTDLQVFVDEILRTEKIDAVICFCSSMAEYIFNNPRYKQNGLAGTKLIMDFVDLDSDKWLQYAKYSKFPLNLIYYLENRRLFKYEIKINLSFHHSIFVSEREVRVFRKLHPEAANVFVISNGVDYEAFVPRQTLAVQQQEMDARKPILVFTGFMEYFANEDGVKWFCEKILPIIRSEFPEVEFYIVGNRPTNVVWSLSGIDGVTVTGYVEDIRSYYWMADVYVTPLRIARGLQNKVLEAMATGNAVVATSNASDGIKCHAGVDIVLADDAETFAKEVISLIRDVKRREELGRNASENIRKNYGWEANLEAFEDLLQSE